jgi:(p)ppGpp synthase/HD superfamily hydrolase
MTQHPTQLNDIGRAIQFALDRHKGQLYAGLPYVYHLSRVAFACGDFGYIDPVHQSACWLHDVVEDTETSIETVIKEFGIEVGRHVWACTGIGENRKERNLDISRKLLAFPKGCIVKASDRIANLEACILDPGTGQPNRELAGMYLKERTDFIDLMRGCIPDPMLTRLNHAFDELTHIVP